MIADRDLQMQCFHCEERCRENVRNADEAKAWAEMALQCSKEPQVVRLRLVGQREAKAI